ncbi:MAG: metal-dependent transcriptional regulator [Anaerolineales bacterium]|jgi:DtxR family Mn-dependent transcriptional regulator|nr:metal-dependent transcriptional regulator [Anaerolineales bacterium]
MVIGLIGLSMLGLLLVFLPTYGLLARLAAWREIHQRELMEDALKHLLDREQQGRHATPQSLAGCLDLSLNKTMELIARIESQNLVESRGNEIHLSPEGERWALHVVRAHRLWERYLADEARMPLKKIHGEAHKREHAMSDAELDLLDAAMGHPTHDPHGDPIPNRDGKMSSQAAVPITAWQAEGLLRITHIEDEPAIAYEQILAAGLRLGQVIRLIEKTSSRYLLSDGENEYFLAPSVATNVHVTPLRDSESALQDAIPLHALTDAQKGEILSLDEGVQGFTRRRFLDLGLTPGTLIYPELKNFFGDPRAYRVRGTLIALRKEQAAQIWVKLV